MSQTNANSTGAESGSKPPDMNYIGSREDDAEHRTLTSRRRLRSQVDHDIEDFLANGGEIKKVDAHVTADPPKKPSSNYGSRPI